VTSQHLTPLPIRHTSSHQPGPSTPFKCDIIYGCPLNDGSVFICSLVIPRSAVLFRSILCFIPSWKCAQMSGALYACYEIKFSGVVWRSTHVLSKLPLFWLAWPVVAIQKQIILQNVRVYLIYLTTDQCYCQPCWEPAALGWCRPANNEKFLSVSWGKVVADGAIHRLRSKGEAGVRFFEKRQRAPPYQLGGQWFFTVLVSGKDLSWRKM